MSLGHGIFALSVWFHLYHRRMKKPKDILSCFSLFSWLRNLLDPCGTFILMFLGKEMPSSYFVLFCFVYKIFRKARVVGFFFFSLCFVIQRHSDGDIKKSLGYKRRAMNMSPSVHLPYEMRFSALVSFLGHFRKFFNSTNVLLAWYNDKNSWGTASACQEPTPYPIKTTCWVGTQRTSWSVLPELENKE